MSQQPTLSELLAALAAANEAENTAKERRTALEAEIAALHADKLPEKGGSKTFEHEGVRFEVKQDFTFKADLNGLRALDAAKHLIKTEEKFDASAYKKLWEFNPGSAAEAAAFVTMQPGKPSVKIKTAKEDA